MDMQSAWRCPFNDFEATPSPVAYVPMSIHRIFGEDAFHQIGRDENMWLRAMKDLPGPPLAPVTQTTDDLSTTLGPQGLESF